MSLRDRLAKLGVELHDIIAENEYQVPAHDANSHEYFAVHYLGVNGENPYLYGGGYGGTFYVSKSGEVYQAAKVTDKLWHVGASSGFSYIHPEARNYNTIGVECATYTASGRNDDDETWYFTEATQVAAAKLAACVAMEYNIPLDHILRHGDITTKNCPSPLKRDQGKGTNWTWDKFKSEVARYMNGGTDESFKGVYIQVG
jgi:N-acetyl-anhydromuramyl-L-alanine amidase AmpD